MSSRDSMPRRLAAVAGVVAGLGLIAVSAEGVLALDSQLEAATAPAVPTRLSEEHRYDGRDGRCRPPELPSPVTREV